MIDCPSRTSQSSEMTDFSPELVYNDTVVNFSTPNETIILLNSTASVLSNLYVSLWFVLQLLTLLFVNDEFLMQAVRSYQG